MCIEGVAEDVDEDVYGVAWIQGLERRVRVENI